MALTKADIAEKLFDDLGLNKREAKEIVELFLKRLNSHWKAVNKSKFPDLENLNYATNAVVRAEIQKPAKKYRLLRVEW